MRQRHDVTQKRIPTMYELSLVELETELAAELPSRSLMRVKKSKKYGHGGVSANGSFGSGVNAAGTMQTNSNPQTVVNVGNLSRAGIRLSSCNSNSASTS